MTDLDDKEPLSNISDSSFIILGHCSMSPSINNETADEEYLEKNESTSMVCESNKSQCNRNTLTKSSDNQSVLEGDIQGKLQELIRENNQLRETLSQNNLAIMSQLDTFYMWQQEVLKTHETHKEKFLETKNLILKLRAENLSLKKQLTEVFDAINNVNDLQISKKDDCALKEENEKLRSMCEDLTHKNEVLEKENMDLRENLKAAEKEVFKLSSELEDSMRERNFLKLKSNELGRNSKNSIGSLTETESPNSEINLLKQLEVESKTLQLKEKLKKANDIISKAQSLNKVEGADECLKSLDKLNLYLDCQNKRDSTLESWVTLTEGNADNANQSLKGEINEATSHSCEKENCEQKQKNLQILKDQFCTLLEDHKALQEQLIRIEDKDKNEISNLYQLIESKERELFQQQQENDRLKETIETLNLQCEEVEILRVQVQLYKSDFNDERDARERLVGEKEAMAEQLRHLQSKLESLEKGPAEQQNEERENESQSFFRPFETRKGVYACPKCMFAFRDLGRCEQHIFDCLNTEFYP